MSSPLFGPDNRPLPDPPPKSQHARTVFKWAREWVFPTGIVVAFVTIWWNYMGGDEFTQGKIKEYVVKRLTEDYIRETVAEVTRSNAAPFIAAELAPLTNQLNAVRQDTMARQDQLEETQADIQRWANLQNLYVTAKGGSFGSYTQLLAIAKGTNELAAVAQGAAVELETFFDSYRFRSFIDYTVHSGGFPRQVTIDYLVAGLKSQNENERRMVAHLMVSHAPNRCVIGHLSRAVEAETNLYTLAQLTRTFLEFTNFAWVGPLDKNSITSWWAANKAPGLDAPYDLLAPFDKTLLPTTAMAREILEASSAVLAQDSQARRALALRAIALTRLGKVEEASREIEKLPGDYGFGWFARAFWSAVRAKTNDALAALKQMKTHDPSLETHVHQVIDSNGVPTLRFLEAMPLQR